MKTDLETNSKSEAASPFRTSSNVQKQHDTSVHSGHDVACPPPASRNGQEEESAPQPQNPGISDPQDISPSSCGIPRSASDAASAWPEVESLAQLHALNQINAGIVSVFENDFATKEQFISSVRTICTAFLERHDRHRLDQLFDEANGDELLNILLPHYQAFFSTTAADPAAQTSDLLYYGALECIIGAFLWETHRPDPYPHPVPLLIRVTREIYADFADRAEIRRQKWLKEEFAERRAEHASRDEHLEHDADLTPAEKMRVFRNAVNARNKVGWIDFRQQLVTGAIKASTASLNKVQKLFSAVPNATAADLLKVMDGCVAAFLAQPPPQAFNRGVRWHARKGHVLGNMIRFLPTILKQLGLAGSSPFCQSSPSCGTNAEEVAVTAY